MRPGGGGQGLVATVYPAGLGVDPLGPAAVPAPHPAGCVGRPVSVLGDEQSDRCWLGHRTLQQRSALRTPSLTPRGSVAVADG